MTYGLNESTIEEVHGVLSRHPEVETAIIYGSRAKGSFRAGSDIDLALTGQSLSRSVIQSINVELDDLMLPYTFDVSILSAISNTDLLDHIKRVGKVFYAANAISHAT